MKSWLDTHICGNGVIWQHKVTTHQYTAVRQGTTIPTVCPVHIYTRAVLGEMRLKTGGKSAFGTDQATVAAVMDWHIQPSPVHCVLQCYDWTNYIILLQLFNPCPSQGGPLIV